MIMAIIAKATCDQICQTISKAFVRISRFEPVCKTSAKVEK